MIDGTHTDCLIPGCYRDHIHLGLHQAPSDLEPGYPGDLHPVGLAAIVAGAVA